MANQRNIPQTMKWTLEHHKLVVDTVLRYGEARSKCSIVRRMMKTVKGLTWSSAFYHYCQIQQLQKETRKYVLSSNRRRKATPRRKPSCELSVLMDDLVRDLKNLNVDEPKLSKWTLEHHKRVVDTLTNQGGLDKPKPLRKTAVEVLKTMEEERRQGLTVLMITKHLVGLHYLQRGTQQKIDEVAKKRGEHGSVMRKLKKVKCSLGHKKKTDQFLPRVIATGVYLQRAQFHGSLMDYITGIRELYIDHPLA